MTDEERQELCEWLRDPSVWDITERCGKAADEIERLAKELDCLKKRIDFAYIENTHATCPG